MADLSHFQSPFPSRRTLRCISTILELKQQPGVRPVLWSLHNGY